MLNSVNLVGRLTSDPEVKSLDGKDAKVCNVSIAVQKPYKNAEGKYDADFFNIVVWNESAEALTKYCKKGDIVGVSGRLQNRSYDTDNGFKRYVTEIVADRISLFPNKKDGE